VTEREITSIPSSIATVKVTYVASPHDPVKYTPPHEKEERVIKTWKMTKHHVIDRNPPIANLYGGCGE
jgi:hypothetical protein